MALDESVIQIESGHLQLGRALQQHCIKNIDRVVSRCFGDLTACTVHFKEEGVYFECTINLHACGRDMVASNKGKDTYVAFNTALTRLKAQILKAKGEMRDSKPQRPAHKDGVLAGPIHRWEPEDRVL